MDTWTSIRDGREAFADYLDGLSADEWTKPSLCEGWTVRDVAAHMLVIPTVAKGRVFRTFLGSGFNLDKMNAKFVSTMTAHRSTTEIAAMTRTAADSRTMPPGLKLPGVLTELAVHSADVAEGVGRLFTLPAEVYIATLQHLKDVQPVVGSKQRIAGLTLHATDADWSTGAGPLVEGPIRQLLLAVAGRRPALEHLTGDGLAILQAR